MTEYQIAQGTQTEREKSMDAKAKKEIVTGIDPVKY